MGSFGQRSFLLGLHGIRVQGVWCQVQGVEGVQAIMRCPSPQPAPPYGQGETVKLANKSNILRVAGHGKFID